MNVWIAETLLATTLLMACALMLRRPAQRWLGAGAAYLLWLLPFARLLLPALPREVVAISPMQTAMDQAGLPVALSYQTVAMPGSAAQPLPWLEIAVTLWIAGGMTFLLFHAVAYARFRHIMLSGAVPVDRIGRVQIVASPKAGGPLAFGVLRPFIVLPADFGTRFDHQEQAMAIAHECAHHARGDLVANMAALGMLALHWWNPIAWIAYRAYRTDQELACDARVLRTQGVENAHAYGRAILKAATGRRVAAACHLTQVNSLKGRLKMLSNHAASLNRINLGMTMVAALTFGGLALTASGSRAAQQVAAITDKVQDVSFARLSGLVSEPSADAVPAQIVPDVPAVPAKPAEHNIAQVDMIVPPAPPVAPLMTADMVPPVPPVPPMPPVSVRNEDGRIVITHADGRTDTRRVPSAAEIARMVSRVDVRNGCEGNAMTSTRESIGADGRKVVRVRICQEAIRRAADRTARQADRDARRTDVASRQVALAQADEARIERQARAGALTGLRAARTKIAHQHNMPGEARAEALKDIDQEIADLEAGRD